MAQNADPIHHGGRAEADDGGWGLIHLNPAGAGTTHGLQLALDPLGLGLSRPAAMRDRAFHHGDGPARVTGRHREREIGRSVHSGEGELKGRNRRSIKRGVLERIIRGH